MEVRFSCAPQTPERLGARNDARNGRGNGGLTSDAPLKFLFSQWVLAEDADEAAMGLGGI